MNTLRSFLALVMVVGLASIALAQETVVTKNADGTYTVIEYPMDREVSVKLLPSGTFTGKGTARVIRSAAGTKIVFDVNGLPATATSYYAYVVDPTGAPKLLGPLKVSNGIASAEFMTPMDKFMIALSPMDSLTGITSSNVILTSEVPTGFAVVPRTIAVGPTSAVAASVVTRYEVPLLNIRSFGEDSKTVKLKFDRGEMKGLEATAHLHRHDDYTTVRVQFDDLDRVSPTKHFVLWAKSPDGQYTRLGEIFNFKKREDAKIETRTSLSDFGLLMTIEDAAVTVPTGATWSVFRII